jgi:hypothetical protein
MLFIHHLRLRSRFAIENQLNSDSQTLIGPHNLLLGEKIMFPRLPRTALVFAAIFALLVLPTAWAQSTSAIQGTVTDSSGAVVPSASVIVQNQGTAEERTTETDSNGHYAVPSLPVGTYKVIVKAPGMQSAAATNLVLEVARTAQQDFKLKVASVETTVEIAGTAPVIEGTTVGVGQVVNQDTVQQIPLNGRHFVDMGLLIPGSVTPPQVGNLTAPLRGQGSFSFNTAGSREDAVNFMINGINLNDMVQNQITFQPSINTVQEFKVDNQTYSAEYGRNSGAIVNIATRSGTNGLHGEVFEFIRNNALDARNFFNRETNTDPTSPLFGTHVRQSTFKRNSFGAAAGGPIWKDRTFFFLSYEALRQRQGVDTNGGVPTSAQRATVTDPAVQKLLALLPLPNSGNNFVGSSTAPVNIDQGTADISHTFNSSDRLHGYYALQQDLRQEPILQGNNLPGFGDTRQSRRQIFTLNETHVFSSQWVNEARLGFNRIFITFAPNVKLNPTDFNISDGITTALGLPQIQVNGLGVGLNFGGPAGFPQGRGDLTGVLSDTISWLHGNHNIKMGGEFRRFNGNSFTSDTGRFVFNSFDNFRQGLADQFIVTPGNRPSRVAVNALGFFAVDSYKALPYFTLELGLRFDWNMSPTEARNRFVNFDQTTSSLLQVGHEVGDVYNQNAYLEPRVGFAWDLFHDGKTILRSAYGYTVDQPTSNLVTPLASNPPFAFPINFVDNPKATPAVPPIPITNAFNAVTASNTIALSAVNHNLKNAYVQQWNLNLQHQVTPTVGMMIGYFGSKGTHLRLVRNLNQIEFLASSTLRPFPNLVGSQSVPCSVFSSGTCPKLSTIAELDDAGNSNYNALWATATKRLSHGVEFSASYTWSKSLDYNSLGSQQGTTVPLEDSTNPRLNYGPSDYDARHRFVLSGLYNLPFHGNRVVEGWQFATIASFQSGNPVNVVTSSGLTGTANTVRPDQLAPITILNQVVTVPGSQFGNVQWFANNGAASICNLGPVIPAGCILGVPTTATGLSTTRFGNMRRNSLLGPGFENVDFSVIKNTKITERVTAEFRAEFFDFLNHPNLGQPNTPGFTSMVIQAPPAATNAGYITNTRFPTGDSGSARQIQFAMKFKF